MTSENEAIEQLWYTWSDIGIDSISAGYRIRAASGGLRDLQSALVQRLDVYQRYLLPKDADLFIDTSIAPVCLALINTGNEHILVHKVYTGRDGVGRYGAFSIHLLAKLPTAFSAIDAISTWGASSFWQHFEVKGRDTLDPVPLAELQSIARSGTYLPAMRDERDVEMIRWYLPLILEAYLTKNLHCEQSGLPRTQYKIYIAATDHEVALLISGLIQCLPEQLVKDLTFSTYEHDVTEATTEIVGTPAPAFGAIKSVQLSSTV